MCGTDSKMQFPLLYPKLAISPPPGPHVNKSKEQLILEKDLYRLLGCVFVDSGDFISFSTNYSESIMDKGYPYFSVTTQADSTHETHMEYFCQGDAYPLAKLSPRCAKMEDEIDRLARERAQYYMKSEWLVSHMLLKPKKQFSKSSINAAVRITIRITDTLRVLATEIENKALALCAYLKVEPLDQMLGPEDHRNWIGKKTRMDNVFQKYLMKPSDKTKNRNAFEKRIKEVLNCYISRERVKLKGSQHYDGVVVSATGTRKAFESCTEQERLASGSVYIPKIRDDMLEGRITNAIQSSLILARGYTAAARKLDQAIDLYFEPTLLPLAMSLHRRVGAESLMGQLDLNTLRLIAAYCVQWIDSE